MVFLHAVTIVLAGAVLAEHNSCGLSAAPIPGLGMGAFWLGETSVLGWDYQIAKLSSASSRHTDP
jgi:hypothetical protein